MVIQGSVHHIHGNDGFCFQGLGDCCQYFPASMTLENFSCLTEYELINLFDIQSSHIREVVMHTIGNMESSLSTSGLIAVELHTDGELHTDEGNDDDEVRHFIGSIQVIE